MDGEDEFQDRLDDCPDDHVCRQVFADWLEERGDPRAEGYRWLGESELYPIDDRVSVAPDWAPHRTLSWGWRFERYDPFPHACLPAKLTDGSIEWRFLHATRRAADDAAARLFALASPAVKAELLAGTGVACGK